MSFISDTIDFWQAAFHLQFSIRQRRIWSKFGRSWTAGKIPLKQTSDYPIELSVDKAEAMASENIQLWLEGQTVRKVIVVPGHLLNIVVS
jgi:leucyl-tRNA synthetase